MIHHEIVKKIVYAYEQALSARWYQGGDLTPPAVAEELETAMRVLQAALRVAVDA